MKYRISAIILIMYSQMVKGNAEVLQPLDSLTYNVEMQTTLGGGDHSPLWLNANRYGLSSIHPNSAFLKAGVSRALSVDYGRKWGIGYGVDLVGAVRHTAPFYIHQLYGELRWLKGVLTVGAKEFPMELKNQSLSSGSQTLGINSRPVPQVRISLPDYWNIPGLRRWVGIKGHIAYGKYTDGKWQEDFTQRQSRYVEGGLYHSKAGYIRIGPKNITLELGLEMACQFGGKSHVFENGMESITVNQGGLKGALKAFTTGGSDATDYSMSTNNSGNHLGSWVARLNFDYPKWSLGIYADHFFEDHSSMFFLDYDGYGTGENWNVKERNRYFLYDLKDMMIGIELRMKKCRWANTFVVEYLYTKYQSGPVYHDHTQLRNTHISGNDNYYNHNLQSGWQHWGMVTGNPLYLSPLYNDDGKIVIKNNRFKAWHFGIMGNPVENLSYRLLTTWQRGWGQYVEMYQSPRDNFSMMGEVIYRLPQNWRVAGAVSFDSGKIYGDNFGVQLTVAKTGLLKLWK